MEPLRYPTASPCAPPHPQIAAGPEEQLRRLLLGGEFAAAAARLAELCPALATNQWLQFQLKRHEFLSLAAGTSSGSGDGGGEARAQQLQRALGAPLVVGGCRQQPPGLPGCCAVA